MGLNSQRGRKLDWLMAWLAAEAAILAATPGSLLGVVAVTLIAPVVVALGIVRGRASEIFVAVSHMFLAMVVVWHKSNGDAEAAALDMIFVALFQIPGLVVVGLTSWLYCRWRGAGRGETG